MSEAVLATDEEREWAAVRKTTELAKASLALPSWLRAGICIEGVAACGNHNLPLVGTILWFLPRVDLNSYGHQYAIQRTASHTESRLKCPENVTNFKEEPYKNLERL